MHVSIRIHFLIRITVNKKNHQKIPVLLHPILKSMPPTKLFSPLYSFHSCSHAFLALKTEHSPPIGIRVGIFRAFIWIRLWMKQHLFHFYCLARICVCIYNIMARAYTSEHIRAAYMCAPPKHTRNLFTYGYRLHK